MDLKIKFARGIVNSHITTEKKLYPRLFHFRSQNIGNEKMCANLQYKSDISNDIYPAMANDSCLTPCTQVRAKGL